MTQGSTASVSTRTPSCSPSGVTCVAAWRRALAPVLLLCLSLLPLRASATDVQGTLSTSAVWKKSASPYVLKGDVTVGWGVKLVIEPGVRVIANRQDALKSGVDPQRVELIVDGTLEVRGTEALPVVFTSRGDVGSWYGIRVRGGRGTVIDGAVISQARQGLSLGMSAVVKNTSVEATVDDCLSVSWGKATLEGNQLRECGENGLTVGEWAKVRVEKTVVTRSGNNGIELRGGGELEHTTVHANGASGVVLLSKSELPLVRDSLITSNGAHGVLKARSARGVLLYNNVWGNAAGDYGASAFAGPGSISANPQYLSRSDLRLGAESPARGVASGGRDMGAFQTPRALMVARDSRGPEPGARRTERVTSRGQMAAASVRGKQIFPVASPREEHEGTAVALARVNPRPSERADTGVATVGSDFAPAHREPQPVMLVSASRWTGGSGDAGVGRRGRSPSVPKSTPRSVSRVSLKAKAPQAAPRVAVAPPAPIPPPTVETAPPPVESPKVEEPVVSASSPPTLSELTTALSPQSWVPGMRLAGGVGPGP